MYSSFLYSIYISTEPIYTSHIYPPARIVIFSSFLSLPFQGLFLFFGQPISPHQKKISQKKNLSEKKFFFSSEKNFYFSGVPSEKKLFLL